MILTRLKLSWKRGYLSVARVCVSGNAGMRRWLTSLKHFFREVGISPSRTCRTASMSSLAAYPPRSLAKRLKRSVGGRTERQDRHHRRSALNHRNAGIRRGSCGEEKTRTASSVVDETTSTWQPGSGRETTRSKYGQRGNVRMRKKHRLQVPIWKKVFPKG